MKRSIILTTAFFFSCCTRDVIVDAYNTIRYENQLIATSEDVASVEFISDQIGFVGTVDGKVFKTINQGNTWTLSISPTAEAINVIEFPTSSIGFIGANNGLFKTIDGGNSWVQVESYPITSISFPTLDVGYAVGGDGFVLKTEDGGDYWTRYYRQNSPFNVPFSNYLLSVSFVDALHGFAAGVSESLYMTENGGITWSARPEGTSLKTYNCVLQGNLGGVIAGDAGILLVNSGASLLDWDESVEQYDFVLHSIDFFENVGVVVGENSIILGDLSEDTDWHYFYAPDASTIPHHYLDVSFVNSNTFIAVGKDGIISKFKLP